VSTEIVLRIGGGNAALVAVYARAEVVRIMREVANRIENGCDCFTVSDINGNNVGTLCATIVED